MAWIRLLNPSGVLLACHVRALRQTLTTTLGGDRGKWYSLSKETHLELARLVIMHLALFGLMSVAQQKAQSLSFLDAIAAVVAIGFGADTV